MKLIDWRKDVAQIHRAELARRWRRPAETIRRWEAGERTPGKSDMAMIFTATDGIVGPSDFFILPEISKRVVNRAAVGTSGDGA